MIARYLYADDASEYCTREVLIGIVGRKPDYVKSGRNVEAKRREQTLRWNLRSDEAHRAAERIRANMTSEDPRRNVEVEV